MIPTIRRAARGYRPWVYGVLLTFLAGIGACGINLFSINEDASLGQQMDKEIQSTPSQYPILQNEPVRGYVQGIVNKIIQSPQIKYKSTFPYKVTLINDDKTINAFATPGGYIYVYTGLLKFVDNEATLAGVLAHEIGHAEERHGTQHMTTQLGADIALSLALGNNPSQLAQLAGNAAVLLGTLKNSRDDELEADTDSFNYLRSTQYWPGSIKYFFDKMTQLEGRATTGTLAQWTSTHPTSEKRVENINSLLKDNAVPAPTSAMLMADNYRTMLKNLR